jgi:tetratricopeptide (TPR) repeat protein
VLVAIQDGRPVPKIIDFGVAKALAQPLTDKTMFTEHGQVVGTPAYMSPEQAEMTGLNVDTRTDIYSLGVMLYQLLVGALPFDPKTLREAGYSGMMKVIRESDPPRPSTRFSSLGKSSKTSAERRRTEPAKLKSVLEGDLDWVVMKAIEKDRNRRYETANGLAMDLQRYLSGAAVLAAPPSRAYLLKKLIRRHRGAVAATGAVVAAVLIGLVAFAWQAKVAGGQRDRAQRAEAEARARADELAVVADFQAGMLEQIDATASGIFLTEDVMGKLDTALEEAGLAAEDRTEQLEGFRGQWARVNATDTARDLIVHSILTPAVAEVDERFAEQPAVAAQLRQVLGDRYRELGLFDDAQPLQQSALETRRRELGDEHPDTLTSVHNMTVLLVAQGKADEAEAFALEALEGRRRVLGNEHAETLDSMEEMGTVLKALGRFDEAEAIRRESLATYRRVFGGDDPGTLNSVNNLGMLLDEMDRAEDALPLVEEALEGRRRVLGEDHPDTLISINNVGYILLALGRTDEAEPYYRECLERSRRLLGDDHPETLISINNLGYLFYTRGEMDQAEPYFREAMERRRRVLGDDHPGVLNSINNYGMVLLAAGRLDEAERSVREALEARQRILGRDHPTTLGSLINLGTVLQRQNDWRAAEPVVLEAYETSRRVLGDEHSTTLTSAGQLGAVYVGLGKNAEAAALLAPLEAVARETFTGSRMSYFALIARNLGIARARLAATPAELAAAEANLLEAYDVVVELRGEDHDRARETARGLADLHAAWDRVEPGSGHDAASREWSAKGSAVE